MSPDVFLPSPPAEDSFEASLHVVPHSGVTDMQAVADADDAGSKGRCGIREKIFFLQIKNAIYFLQIKNANFCL